MAGLSSDCDHKNTLIGTFIRFVQKMKAVRNTLGPIDAQVEQQDILLGTDCHHSQNT